MRPGHFAEDQPGKSVANAPAWHGFNEASAFRRRSRWHRRSGLRAFPSFNEASAFRRGSLNALKSHVDGVNMNILTLQEQGWEVEAQIDDGGFIQMRVVRQIN